MDVFQHRYYRLGKILMLLTGIWPYQSTYARRSILVTISFFVANVIVAEIKAIVKYRYDWNILMQCFLPIFFDGLCLSKYIGSMWNSQKMLKLLHRIRADWEVWARHEEVKILHKYAERGEMITIVYTAFVYCVTFVFMIQPMITKLIDIVLYNGTEPGKFPFPIVYDPIDIQKYYYFLIMYGAICALILLTAFVSSEVMLILYVQHVCGLFAAVGNKLERIGSNDPTVKTDESPYALDKVDKVYLTSCIDRHNDAIEYADLIKATYVWTLCFNIVFGTIILNLTGLQIFLRKGELGTILTCLGVTLATLFNFYIHCCISQILINHSLSIRFYINNSQWYRLPLKSQKILHLMTIRCNKPCWLTAGKILILSVRSFALTTRTLMSYFTFMRSTQGI